LGGGAGGKGRTGAMTGRGRRRGQEWMPMAVNPEGLVAEELEVAESDQMGLQVVGCSQGFVSTRA